MINLLCIEPENAPTALNYWQFGATALVGFAATAIAVMQYILARQIASQQRRVEEQKLKADLYDRRFEIYQATKKLLMSLWTPGPTSKAAFDEHWISTSGAVFLFGEEVPKFIEELREEIANLDVLLEESEHADYAPGSPELKELHRDKRLKYSDVRRMVENLDTTFEPYMHFPL